MTPMEFQLWFDGAMLVAVTIAVCVILGGLFADHAITFGGRPKKEMGCNRIPIPQLYTHCTTKSLLF